MGPERPALTLLLGALLAGCPAGTGPPVDPLLPEEAVAVEHLEPLALLEAGATDLDPIVRARALAGLVRTSPDHGGGAWGPRALADPDAWVQRAAAEALAERLPEEATAALLLEYLGRSWADPYVRSSAAMALGAVDPAGAQEAAAAAWRAEGDAWRRAPLALAAARLGDAEATEILIQSVSRADVALEVGFVLDLGTAGIPALADAMKEGSGWVEEELALTWTAARLAAGDASAEGELRRALDGDEDEQLEVLDALVRVPGGDADTLLRRAASQGTDKTRHYARLVSLTRGRGDATALTEAAIHEDAEIRRLAARCAADAVVVGALTRTRDARTARKVVADLLADPQPSVRLEAVVALRRLGVEDEGEALRALLDDEGREVRVEAAALLVRG